MRARATRILVPLVLASCALLACSTPPGAGPLGADAAVEAGAGDGQRLDVEPLLTPEPPRGCEAAPLDEPDRLSTCALGNGVFGFFRNDEAGLPAYEYTIDQLTDLRARYDHTRLADARQHFHQLGNDRVNAVAYNDGHVELVGQERGVTFYNRFDPERGNLAGGFSIIGEGDRAWSSAHRWRPAGAATRRVFGIGYYETQTQHDGLRVSRRVITPPGDGPLLVDEVELQNLTGRTRTIRHYEYWDVNRHQAAFQLLRSPAFAHGADLERSRLNAPFDQRLTRLAGAVLASFEPRDPAARPPREAVSREDHYPATVFAASLGEPPAEVYTDQRAFIGADAGGEIASPAAARSGRGGELMPLHPAVDQPAALILRHDVVLGPGERKRLRFAYGYLPHGAALKPLLARHRAPAADALKEAQSDWRRRLAYCSVPEHPVLSREVPWHAYYLLSATAKLDYFDTRVTPQGSAYLYLHGFDGAPRDQALFSLALSYLDPALARANLELIMRLTHADEGNIAYSYHGHGVAEDAVIHKNPSDLDIFLILALAEYLAATGDRAFLQRRLPFYPLSAGDEGTVLEHVRRAVDHLIDFVGRGEHGLVRIWDGDWSDGIVWSADADRFSPELSIAKGESVPNTQMAVHALPLLAAQIEPLDAALAARMRAYADQLRAPARAAYVDGKWFLRAWLRDLDDVPVARGDGSIDLEAQPWGVIAGLLGPTEQAALLSRVHDRVDADSPIGPAMYPGGQVWPAVAQLQTWAYARAGRPEWAWSALGRQTLASHAEAFPELWHGIWSAPDGMSSKSGKSWASVATPMKDWPVMNSNHHAMFLLGLLRTLGVEPEGGALAIRPRERDRAATLELPLLRIALSGDGRLEAEYRARNDGALQLVLGPPPGAHLVSVSVAGEPRQPGPDGDVRVTLALKKGDRYPISLRWEDAP